MNDSLARLIEAARERGMDESNKDEQRINFAFGNAAEGDKNSTKETIRYASALTKAS